MADNAWAVTAIDDAPAPVNDIAEPFTEDHARDAIDSIAPGATITSQGRTPTHNAAVGGVPNSMHLDAQASDVVLPKGVTPAQFKANLVARGFPVTEFLDEGTHVHWGWGPKGGAPANDPWAPTHIDGDPTQAAASDPWAPTAIDGKATAPNDGHWHNTPQENADLDAFIAADKTAPEAGENPSPTWIDTLKSAVTSTPARWKQMGAAALMAIGEHPPAPSANITMMPGEDEGLDTLGAARTVSGQKMAAFGRQVYAGAAADVKANMPNLDDSTAKRIAFQVTSGTIDMLPVLAGTTAAIITRNPAVIAATTYGGAAYIAGQAGASKYGEARASGRSADQASMDATFTGISNGALAMLPLGVLMKPGGSFLAQTLKGAGAFGAISVVTEALQLGYDKGLVTPDMTWAQAWPKLVEAGIVGTLQGALLSAGHAGLESAVNRLHAATPPPAAKAPYGPPQKPPPVVTADAITAHAKDRLAHLDLAAKGDPDAKMPGPDGKMVSAPVQPRFLSRDEIAERAFLRQNADDPAALAKGYQVRLEPTPGSTESAPPPVQTPPQVRPNQPTPTTGPVHADIRSSLGLDHPGIAPEPDPWAPAESAAAGQPSPAGEFPKVPPREAAAVEGPGIPRRALESDVAVTATGREVPVQYALVEASHLVPSQTQEGNPNPAFPAELQPRDRTRAVSQAQIAGIAQNINPRLLDRSVNASDGAPIVAPSGVVESGNGRSLAIQRAYAENLPSATQYRNYLAERGYPVDGMEAPVLVRIRSDTMPPEDRQAFVREANQSGHLGYSATERAMSDAAALPDHALGLYRGGDIEAAGNRDFVRAFMMHAMPTTEHGAMVDTNGNLSLDGARRVRAALLAKAYADPDLVGSVVENADSSVKAIGGALTDASGGWAAMRDAAGRGEIPPALDQTSNLLEAVKLVARARQDGRNVAEFVGQPDIFTGQAIDPDVEAWLRLMFRNTKDWTQPVGRDKLAEALSFYAREAQKAHVGVDLLGQGPVAGADILKAAKARQYGEQSSGPGPSLSFGEDVRTHGEPGAEPGFEGSEAGRGAGAPSFGTQGRGAQVRGDFGPAPASFTTTKVETGPLTDLTHEARDYLGKAGVGASSPVEKIAALANWVAQRGRSWGQESFASLSGRGDLGAASQGERSTVKIGPEVLRRLADPAQHIVSVHNHPSNGSFSGGDTATLAYPGHAGMVVVGHEGDWHAMALTNPVDPGADIMTRANALTRAQATARDLAEKFADFLHKGNFATDEEAEHILNHVTMRALEESGLTHYLGPDRISPAHREGVDRAIAGIGKLVREQIEATSGHGLKLAAPGVHRPARSVHQLGAGLADVLSRAGRYAGFAGSEGGAGAGAERSQVPGKPVQLKLLEDERRYESERPPFYSALTRSIEDSKLNRATAKDWSGLIDNLRAKGVKEEEISWSGVKDWLGEQKGPVTKAALLDHLRQNEVRVQEVEKGGGARTLDETARAIYPELGAELRFDDLPPSAQEEVRAEVSGRINRTGPKFGSYTLPGGERYRELLLTLPSKAGADADASLETMNAFKRQMREKYGDNWLSRATPDELETNHQLSHAMAHKEDPAKIYRSSHWDEPNVLAHIRFDDRTGPNGEKILHIAEVQSDWAKAAHKSGFQLDPRRVAELDARRAELEKIGGDLRSDGKEIPQSVKDEWAAVMNELQPHNSGKVPRAPFVGKTEAWSSLAMKRMLRYASEHGYDKISWDTGTTNALRYPDALRQKIDSVSWSEPSSDGMKYIHAKPRDGGMALTFTVNKDGKIIEASNRAAKNKNVDEVFGKDMAGKIMAEKDGEIESKDFMIGAKGFEDLYDKQIPQFLNKYGKKWGAKVEDATIPKGGHASLIYEGPTPSAKQMEQVREAISARPTDQRFISPITGERQEYQINRAHNDMAMRNLDEAIWGGKTFAEAMNEHGMADFARLFGGDMVNKNAPVTQAPTHQIAITPAMRESVMHGQPLFEEKRRYTEEPGAVDAKGNALPQAILPGAEPSAVQLAKSREAAAGGKMGTKVQQKPPGDLFGAQGVPGDDQLSLFEDARRYDRERDGAVSPDGKTTQELLRESATKEQILGHIAQHSDDSERRHLARVLSKTIGSNITYRHMRASEAINQETGNYRAGFYDGPRNFFTVHADLARDPEKTFLHEAVHAATVQAINHRTPTGKEINKLFDAYHALSGSGYWHDTGDQYGFRNPKEFIAEALSNPKFRAVLDSIKAAPPFEKSMLQKLYDTLRKMFGLKPADPMGYIVANEPKVFDPKTVLGGAARETLVVGKSPYEPVFGQDESRALFEDPRRYGEIPRDDREALERAARTGNWIGRYGAEGASPDSKIRTAIAGAFKAWERAPRVVPEAVRTIFGRLGGGGSGGSGGGGGFGGPPEGFRDIPTSRPTEAFSAKLKRAADAAMDLVHDAQMLIAPMAEGTAQARATAKDFANMMRLARWHGQRMMEGLKKNFDHTQLRRMWDAADEESVLRQEGKPTAGKGLSTLTPEERRAVLEQQSDAQSVWRAAQDQGMVEGDGLPSYVPRMMVEMAGGEVKKLGSGEEARSIPGIGRNLKTSTPQMKQRKHLTTEETETAGGAKFGTIASVVRDIRTLPLATMRLREAVAGRALINKIKEIGQKTGEDTVVEGHEPAGTPYKWFTLDHPAFKTWRPKLIKNEETGKYEPATDQNGDMVFEKVPLYVRGDFEGPLRAVLSLDSGKVYNGLMSMKGRAMTAIMYSPLIHNAVEWGRALPAMPGKVITLRIYFEGNRAKRDPATMTEAIMHGLVPIGHQAGMQDVTSIANVDSIKAGRSWTAKIVGAIPGIFSRDAQDAVYRTIDKMGDVWHNTLLWDRVGDLQMGLYTNLRDHLIKKGATPDAAQYAAAHFSNRYAGALPLEAMSTMSRKIANLALFSRTYTLGNLGAMKDVLTGLPRDVQAQIGRSGDLAKLKGIRSLAARKALAILATDIALFYAGNSILQSAVSYLSNRQDLDDIEKGYVDRLNTLLHKVKESPLELLNPFADMQALSATSENEPGRENRVLVGYDHNGTAIYARNPVGKIGEEFTNWLRSPIETGKSKFSTFLRPTWAVLNNDAGFGRKVYDPKEPGYSGIAHAVGNIVSLYLGSQIPLDSLKSAANVLKGQGSEIDTYKVLGPLGGVTFSKGAPGGPGVGELFALRDAQNAKRAAAMPDIIQKIKNGDIAGARADMRGLGISPGLQNYYVRVTQNPRLRLSTRSARELLRQATPEERARILQPTGTR